jgi:S-adenosylmethionine uptake transporter
VGNAVVRRPIGAHAKARHACAPRRRRLRLAVHVLLRVDRVAGRDGDDAQLQLALFLAILLAVLARERPDAKLVGTVVLGFAGVVLLLQPTFEADQWWPGVIGLVSGAISAVAYWNVRELVRNDEPEARVVFYFGVFALAGALVWMAPQRWHVPTAQTWWMVLGVGGLGALGQVAMTRAYGHGSTLVTAALSYSGIVFSSVIGIAWLDDRPSWAALLGIVLIVAAGILAVQLRPDRRREDATAQVTND